MCGISCIFFTDNKRNSFTELQKMNQSIFHRGPDDEGLFKSGSLNLSMGMRRLTILDDIGGKQPMISGDGRYILVFNGEIINSKSLRAILTKEGCKFNSSHSDTEVLLNLLITKGIDGLHLLNGMFSFIFYDSFEEKLLVARDRMGIKPLYKLDNGKNIYFCSEISGILKTYEGKNSINYQSAFNYLSLMYIPDHNSIYNEIEKQKPGTFTIYDLKTNQSKEDYFFKFNFKNKIDNVVDLDEKLENIFKDSIKNWSISDCPISCSLSGGLDSSAIAYFMNETKINDIHTFTLGFDNLKEERFNELENAKSLANQLNSFHKEVTLTPHKLIEDIEDIVSCMEEPYGGGVPSWLLFKIISQDHKVVFTGTGADEIFGSYGKWRRLFLLGLVKKGVSKSDFKKFFFQRGIDGRGYYFKDDEKRKYFLNNQENLQDTNDYLFKIFQGIETDDIVDKLSCFDMQTQLTNEFLNMSDKFSMAFSLECRPPFLDNKMIDFFMETPSSARTKFFDFKFLVKNMLKNKIPNNIISGPKKGFEIPLEQWLKNDLRELIEDHFSASFLKRQGIFHKNIYDDIIYPYLNNTKSKINNTQIWGLLMFQLWYSKFMI